MTCPGSVSRPGNPGATRPPCTVACCAVWPRGGPEEVTVQRGERDGGALTLPLFPFQV